MVELLLMDFKRRNRVNESIIQIVSRQLEIFALNILFYFPVV